MAWLSMRVNLKALFEFFKEKGLDLTRVQEVATEWDSSHGIKENLLVIWAIIREIVTAVAKWEADHPGELDGDGLSKLSGGAVDALLEFTGPIGRLIELADGAIVELIVKGAYESVRNRGSWSKEEFLKMVLAMF